MLTRTIGLAVALGIAGIALTLWWLGEDLATLGRVPIGAFAAAVGLLLLNYLCGATRLLILTRVNDHPIGFWRSLRAYIMGLFSAAVTPGGSGQAPAVVLSLLRDGVPATTAWSINVYVWVLDLFFLAWSVPTALMVIGLYTDLLGERSPMLFALLAGVVFLASWYGLAYHLLRLRRGLFWGLSWRPLKRWRRPALRFLHRVAQATAPLPYQHPLLRLMLHALTVTLYLATYLTFYVFARSVGSDAPLLPTVAAVLVPSVMAFAFPTPGGAGLLEIAAASLFRVQAQGTAVAAALLAWRLVTFYSRFLVGPALGGTLLMQALGRQRALDDDAGRR